MTIYEILSLSVNFVLLVLALLEYLRKNNEEKE